MNITEAAEKYGVDGATIWEWIASGFVLANNVRLVALPEERIVGVSGEATQWVVREEKA